MTTKHNTTQHITTQHNTTQHPYSGLELAIYLLYTPLHNGKHQLLAYADYVNILGGSIHTLKENAEALVAATREIGLEVRAGKTKYMVMSRDQNAGRFHSVRVDNSTFGEGGRV